MTSNNLMSSQQYGFCAGRSCELQLLVATNKWTAALSQHQNVDAVYLDLKKAFDKVPHQRLIKKLQAYGITGHLLAWFTDFLSDRRQAVQVDNAVSDWLPVISGVPQGSVVGPILFNIFVNDLPSRIHSGILLFADDTKIERIISNQQDHDILQQDVQIASQWAHENQILFNIDKCVVIHFGRTNPRYTYQLEGVPLLPSECEMDLGVYVDSALKFQRHIDTKVAKASQALAVIRRAFSRMPENTFVQLYKGLVRPHLEYASSVWSPHLNKDIIKLENVQRRATKYLPGMRNLPYETRLRRLGLPTLQYRRQRQDMILVYKLTHSNEVSSTSLFELNTESHTRGHSLKLTKKRALNNNQLHSFSHRIVETWNALPHWVVNSTSMNAFKSNLNMLWRDLPGKFSIQ